MAEPLPASLKIPEVSRFVNRANQLRSIKPAIAYWCDYHAVNQIVAKSLHTADDDAYAYTKTLIERLETTKTEHASDESIVDNAVGQATVEMFAQQTFARAERALRANKATRQTADTFDAAATFYDLLREWGELDAEVVQKIKFAKWNAARILKAIREGKDPNESNPKMQAEEPADDDMEAELRELETKAGSSAAHPVTIEDAPETEGASAPPPEEYFPQIPPGPAAVSPLNDAPPTVPASAPGVPPEAPPSSGSQIPPQPSPQIPTKIPPQFAPPPPEPTLGAPTNAAPPPAALPSQPPGPVWAPSAPAPAPAPGPAPAAAPAAAMHYKDINQAQKHAKWAISALNFEDVPTAVQELRNALAMLGAQ